MASRFASNLTLAILAAVLIPMALASGAQTVAWLALGVGSATVIVTLVGFAYGGRGRRQRLIDAIAVLLGAWIIIAARVFAGAPARWLAFSEGAALFGLAAVGLIGHELIMQRALRSRSETAAADAPGPREATADASGPRELHPALSERQPGRRVVSG